MKRGPLTFPLPLKKVKFFIYGAILLKLKAKHFHPATAAAVAAHFSN